MANVRRMRASLLLSKLIPMVPRAPIDAMARRVADECLGEARAIEKANKGKR